MLQKIRISGKDLDLAIGEISQILEIKFPIPKHQFVILFQ